MNEPVGPPPGVAQRLIALRHLYVPETAAEASARLHAEKPPITEPFEVGVDRRLRELRALCELANHLHKAKFGPTST